jgi:hypothetical protein
MARPNRTVRPIAPGGGGSDRPPLVLAKVYLKGREIAEAMAEDTADQLARE